MFGANLGEASYRWWNTVVATFRQHAGKTLNKVLLVASRQIGETNWGQVVRQRLDWQMHPVRCVIGSIMRAASPHGEVASSGYGRRVR